MAISTLQIEKFKSYSNCKIEGLNDKINIIFGKNGSGKSNLLAALLFLCSDQYDRADRAQLMKNYREGEPKVEAHISNIVRYERAMQDSSQAEKIIPTSGDKIVVSRSLGERENAYRVDDRNVNLGQFNNIFECFGIQRKNPFMIVAQNRVQEIANMTDSEIYRLLQQVAGVESFLNKQEKAEELFEKSQKEKVGIEISLSEVEEKIKQLSGEKDHYSLNQQQETLLQSLQWLFYEKTKEELSKKKIECDKELKIKEEKLLEEKNKLGELENIKVKQNEEVSTLKDRQTRIQSIEDSARSDCLAIELKMKGLETSLSELHSLKDDKDEKKISERINLLQSETASFQRQAESVNEQVLKQKEKIEEKEGEYSKYVVRDHFKTTKEREKFFSERRKDIKSNMGEKTATEQNLKKKLSEIKKQTSIAETETKKVAEELLNSQKEVDEMQKTLNGKKLEMQKVRQNQLETRKELTDKKIEVEELGEKTKKKADEIQKQLKSSLFNIIERLEEAIISEGIIGYEGLLIDHLEFNSKLAYVYDIAQRNKLFSLVVNTEETAARIVELSKKIDVRGANLNIYPLSWVSDDIQDEDGGNNANVSGFGFQKLFDSKYVKAKGPFSQDIERLAKSIFGNYGMVKNYEKAVEVASKFKINCITEDRQVAYSGGFISRVGYCNSNKLDKITLYEEYKSLKNKRNKLKESLLKEEQQISKLESLQNSLSGEINKLQIQVTKSQNSVFLGRQMLKSSEMELRVAGQEYQEAASLLISVSAQVQELEGELKGMENIEQSEEYRELSEKDKKLMYSLQEEIKRSTSELEKMMREKSDMERKVQQRMREMEQLKGLLDEGQNDGTKQLDHKMLAIEAEINHQKQLLHAHQEIVKKSESGKKQLLIKIQKLQEDSDENKHKEQVQLQRENCNSLEQQMSTVLLKKQQYILKENEIDKKKELLSVSPQLVEDHNQLSREQLRAKLQATAQSTTIKKYTARDKILFEKIKDLDAKYTEYSDKFQILIDNEAEAKKLIHSFQSKCDSTTKLAFSKFEHYLKQFFNRVSPKGSIEIKLLHGKEISVSLTFKESSADTKKSNRRELSGGEKSCLAILILMALQRCDPAPFYIFDEFDAALDQNYIRQISKIISENSKKSQFIIVSHKAEFISSLNPADCKCFQISLKDKISEISETTLEAAINFVKEG